MMVMRLAKWSGALAFLALSTVALNAAAQTDAERYQIPSTVSPEAAAALTKLYEGYAKAPKGQIFSSAQDWDRLNGMMTAGTTAGSVAFAASQGVTVVEDRLGQVPILRIRPSHYKPTRRKLIYLHGGGYVMFSAKSSLIAPALIAAATGDEVISVDYTLAPHADWRVVTDQVIAVWRAVLASGADPAAVGLFGDSAGGGLAAGSVLKMRDLGLPLPGALWLISPAADISGSGDSYATLAGVDPVLSLSTSAQSAEAYAPKADQKNPYVSPVYGDYSKPFPPTLIQGGTREMLLSNFVREYQAIRSGGHVAVLDLYEGMPHDFQIHVTEAPEGKTAIARAAAFLTGHLSSR